MPVMTNKEVEIEVTNDKGEKSTFKANVDFPVFSDLKDALGYATQNPKVQKPRGRNTDESKNVTLTPEMSIVKGYQASVHAAIRLSAVNKLELEHGGFDKQLQAFARDLFERRAKIGKPITMEKALEKAKTELTAE